MSDYMRRASESLLETQKIYHLLEIHQMVEESEFIKESMDLGYIVLRESDSPEMIAVTESISEAIAAFFEKISEMFRKKAVSRKQKYGPWYAECAEQLKEKAKNAHTMDLKPFWKGEWNRDSKDLVMAVDKAYDNYENKKYDDYSFAKAFLANPKESITGENSKMKAELITYFRYHIKSADDPEPIKMTGEALSSIIDEMLKFNTEYSVGPTKSVDSVNTAIAKRLMKVDAPSSSSSTTESFTSNSWLSIEQRPVCESMLNTLANYTTITEADEKPKAGAKPNEDKAETTAQATKVEVSDDKAKPGQQTADGKSGTKADDGAMTYWKNIEKFFKLAVSSYQTAMDERFIMYNNVFLQIASGSELAPKFDKDGKYIPIDQRKKESDQKPTEVKKSEETSEKEDNKSRGGKVIDNLKQKGNAVRNKLKK